MNVRVQFPPATAFPEGGAPLGETPDFLARAVVRVQGRRSGPSSVGTANYRTRSLTRPPVVQPSSSIHQCDEIVLSMLNGHWPSALPPVRHVAMCRAAGAVLPSEWRKKMSHSSLGALGVRISPSRPLC